MLRLQHKTKKLIATLNELQPIMSATKSDYRLRQTMLYLNRLIDKKNKNDLQPTEAETLSRFLTTITNELELAEKYLKKQVLGLKLASKLTSDIKNEYGP